MLTSLSYIFLVGSAMAGICQRLKLPRIIGMLVTGIVLGPYFFDLLDPKILSISGELRQIALIIILLKAGLSLDLSDLRKVGRPAIMMSFLPACFEIAAYIIFAPLFMNITRTEAAIMGAVLGAVSPAVVIPRMVKLVENKYGTKKGIPQLILAGASGDDVFVIVLFSTFVSMAMGSNARITEFFKIPLSIIMGIIIGAVIGFSLYVLFEYANNKSRTIKNSMKVVIVLGVSFMLMSLEIRLKEIVSFSGLLAVISMAMVLKYKTIDFVSSRLSEKFGKLWIGAEILLFVLVGAAVDIRYTMDAGVAAVIMIFTALIFRSVGVLISLLGTDLSSKEKLFCTIAYLPKATVQAAIGSVPLGLGLASGKIILSVAVLSILITAPLGALGMDISYKKLLEIE